MAINLANVDIPIQQFQAISKGDYNAGEVKLAGEQRNRRKDVRAETDRGTAGRRRLPSGNREVALFQDLLAGNTRFRNAADHEALLELARRQKAEFLLSVGGQPDATKGAVIEFRTAAGQRIRMAAGCTETEYLAKLDEMILRLSSVQAPDARTLAVRAEFNALPTNTAKNTWTYDLSQDPDRGFKFRTAAIAALVERGVVDHATLSAINRLSVDRTRLLLQTVLMTLSNLRGDALRNHQLVRLVLHEATTRPVEVPEDQRAYIPAVPPDAPGGNIAAAP